MRTLAIILWGLWTVVITYAAMYLWNEVANLRERVSKLEKEELREAMDAGKGKS